MAGKKLPVTFGIICKKILGFEVPNKFIVGYGFDDENGFARNIPYIGYKE